MKHNFIKIDLVSPKITIGSPLLNVNPILKMLDESKADIILFPELTLSGYTAGDLFYQSFFLDEVYQSLEKIVNETTYKGIYILGLPYMVNDVLYNIAVVIQNKKIIGAIPKYFLPNTKEFYERRWFREGIKHQTFDIEILGQKVPFGHIVFKDEKSNISFGVEICQDMWGMFPPSNELVIQGAQMIFNLSSSPENIYKPETRRNIVIENSRRQIGGYFYTSSAYESSTDLVFSDHKIAAVNGDLIDESDPSTLTERLTIDINIEFIRHQRRMDTNFKDIKENLPYVRKVSVEFKEDENFKFAKAIETQPFLPGGKVEDFSFIHTLQVRALVQKLSSIPTKRVIIGMSGGLDSTLAMLVLYDAYKALNRDVKDIIGVTLPSEVTSHATKSDALRLMESLGVTSLEIPIKDELNVHLNQINHKKLEDVTYENAQARIRTLYLMNLSNQYDGIVLGTGDLSEIALGWMTFNGDHMSMYNPNSGIPKTIIRALVLYHAEHGFKMLENVLKNIAKRPISPELKSNQLTEDSIGRYEINDFMLYYHLVEGADENTLTFLVKEAFMLDDFVVEQYVTRFFKRFYTQQFKRIPMPEGPKIFKVSLSPRGDLRLPADIKRK